MRKTVYTAAALLLAACASSEQVRYFTLEDGRYIHPGRSSPETAVRVYLAEPLGSGGMVYQTDAHHLNTARSHLWAAPLDNTLAAVFSNKLNRSSTRSVFVPAARSSSSRVLKIYIEAFQGSYRGSTQISGYAVLPDGRTRPFDVETPQQGNGYAAMAESLNQGLEQAARVVAE